MKWLEPLRWIASVQYATCYSKVVVLTKSHNMFITDIIDTGDGWRVWCYKGNDPNDTIIGWSPIPEIPSHNDKIGKLQQDDPVERLELSIRATNCLIREGLITIRDVLNKTVYELLKVRNLGKRTFDEINDALISAGFSLKE